MRKVISRLCLIILVLFITSGCSSKSEKVSKEELNIIDDNYRTYYEIFLYSFCDSNGDGIGDMQGLISKLDYLNDNDPDTDTDLGVNGIWLMPMMPSTTYHKYDVIDYYDIDKEYGTLDDFKLLLKECDERGIKVIIDLVFNHTSAQNEWFKSATEYITSLPEGKEPSVEENPYFGYYNFKKDAGNRSTYQQIGNTDWYYECMFWDQMPDLNLTNPVVRKEIEKVADYWLDMGVGGFRLDAAKEFFSGDNAKNIEVLNWFTDYVKNEDPDNYLVAEVWDTIGTYSSYYGSGIDSVFNFAFAAGGGKIATTVNDAGSGKAGASFAKAMEKAQSIFMSENEKAIDASFLTNHDVDRAAGYVSYDENLTKLEAGLNLMMSGSSFIYYGEELGMTGSGKDENKRAPMYWTEKESEDMTSGPVAMEPQINHFGTVEDQMKESSSVLNYYIDAVRLRNENPEIARGAVKVIPEVKDGDIGAITKTYNDSSIVILYNLSGDEKQVTINKDTYGYERIKGCLSVSEKTATLDKDTVTLPPYAIVILK